MGAFRRGVIVGFAVGYVKGSKAGRERYEQINRNWKKVKGTPTYQKFSEKAGALVGLGIERGKIVALDTLEKATHRNKDAASRGHNGY